MRKIIITGIIFLSGLFLTANAQASVFTEIPFTFTSYSEDDLDWYDYDDESSSGSTELGFSVTLGGDTYDHFDLNSNGYVQLLSGSQVPTDYGYGSVDDLINADTSSTYLLAAYDDLSSYEYGFFGYKLFPEKAVFYYDTETYYDEGYELLNNFEMILSKNGKAQWNFNYADYSGYDYDLYSGLRFGNTDTLHELARDYLPTEKSYIYRETQAIPEPATLSLLGIGLAGLLGLRKRS